MSLASFTPEAPVPEESESFRTRGLGIRVQDILLNRWLGLLGLAGVILGAFVLPPTGLGVGTCTMKATTGLPCPGCGLTRSVTSIYHGYWLAAWQLNPLGYFFATIFAVMGFLALLPNGWREAIRARLARINGPLTIIFIVFLTLFLIHGFARIGLILAESPHYQWWTQGDIPPAFQRISE